MRIETCHRYCNVAKTQETGSNPSSPILPPWGYEFAYASEGKYLSHLSFWGAQTSAVYATKWSRFCRRHDASGDLKTLEEIFYSSTCRQLTWDSSTFSLSVSYTTPWVILSISNSKCRSWFLSFKLSSYVRFTIHLVIIHASNVLVLLVCWIPWLCSFR